MKKRNKLAELEKAAQAVLKLWDDDIRHIQVQKDEESDNYWDSEPKEITDLRKALDD